ncbi:HD domain-containing protein [Aureispira anguillae]|uniref:HD domain-containing protein n=1 Tax=Aureispira anguillae TaxID=2864201 RepID=A0A915YGF0_9BACT|nr:HD domain-containing protein [Aureispira anguillae]BDS12623.1 HD domain-containing protein [Aureispira anguillae]
MLIPLEQQIKQYVTQLFEQANTSKLPYHNLEHTIGVVQRIEALSQTLPPRQIALLKIAGWFHDIGYLYGYDQHEDRGIVIARNYLASTLDAVQLDKVSACIEATKTTVKPSNQLEEIIKDADIGYGTTEHFFETGPKLRAEWELMRNKIYNDLDWETLQYDFLQQVVFYSDIAQATYLPILKQNRLLQKQKLNSF